MNDYISRQAAIESIATVLMQMDDPDAPRRTVEDYMPLAESMIRGVPAADVREVKRGRWTENESCPFCGFQPWYENDIHTLSFCPNCGAEMEESE